MRNEHSDYIIFADESGDHGITSINPENPVFVLVFCIFKKADYISIVKQAVAKFKIDFWGHDLVILHNHAIRKANGEFVFLFDEEKRAVFLHALNEMIKTIPFSIATTAIDKRLLGNTEPENPYFLALGSCLDQTLSFLESNQQLHRLTHLIVESRGKPEDKDLGLAFDLIATGMLPKRYPLKLSFASKQTNNCGLQIADLVAYPIARHVIKRAQSNKAFEIVKEKLLGFPEYENIGLRFYSPKSEKPQQALRPDADRELPIHL